MASFRIQDDPDYWRDFLVGYDREAYRFARWQRIFLVDDDPHPSTDPATPAEPHDIEDDWIGDTRPIAY